jgi:hypothetical protein
MAAMFLSRHLAMTYGFSATTASSLRASSYNQHRQPVFEVDQLTGNLNCACLTVPTLPFISLRQPLVACRSRRRLA